MADMDSYKALGKGILGNQPSPHTQGKVRLSNKEYKQLEQAVQRMMPPLTSSEAGSLGMRVGADLVLRALRDGFVISG